MSKIVKVALELDEHFIRMLNAHVMLNGGINPDRQLTAAAVLERVVLAEARGACEIEVDLTVPPEWRGNINILHDEREVREEE